REEGGAERTPQPVLPARGFGEQPHLVEALPLDGAVVEDARRDVIEDLGDALVANRRGVSLEHLDDIGGGGRGPDEGDEGLRAIPLSYEIERARQGVDAVLRVSARQLVARSADLSARASEAGEQVPRAFFLTADCGTGVLGPAAERVALTVRAIPR